MPIASYKVGPPIRPPIAHDNGFLDRYRPRPPTLADRARYAEWRTILATSEAVQGVPFVPHNDLPDALAAYRHFLYGKGVDRTFSYERYVQGDPSGRLTFENAVLDARIGAEDVFVKNGERMDSFQMCSTVIPCGSDNPRLSRLFPYPQTENWQKAIGAHEIWLSASVMPMGKAATREFSMFLTLHAEDRYNFNPKSADLATNIPDAANGVFEVTGLAKQYMNYATMIRRVQWHGFTTIDAAIGPYTGGRLRKPSDNRRARNRV